MISSSFWRAMVCELHSRKQSQWEDKIHYHTNNKLKDSVWNHAEGLGLVSQKAKQTNKQNKKSTKISPDSGKWTAKWLGKDFIRVWVRKALKETLRTAHLRTNSKLGGSLTDKRWQVQLKTNKKGKGLTASFLSCRVKICGDMHGERNLKWLLNVKFHTNKIVDISTPAHFKSWQLIFKCLYILLIPI